MRIVFLILFAAAIAAGQTITVIQGTDRVTDSRAVINTNFAELNTYTQKKQTYNDLTQIATPGTNPAAGYLRVYAKTGSGICWKDSAGTETCAGAGGGGTGIWGSITGTLSDQTDLQSALSAKQNSLGFTPENAANKGIAGGYAALDGSSLLPSANLPSHNHAASQITSGRLAFARGGLDLATLPAGAIVYGSGLDTPGAATLGSTLQISAGVMSVVQSALNLANIGGTASLSQLGQSGASLNQVVQWNGSAWVPATLSGAGTVTSVGLSLPAELDVSGSPITGAGTLSATWAAETNNFVFSGPATGGSGTPAFRALVAADVPALDASKVTSGTFGAARIPDLSSVYQPLDADLTAVAGLSTTGMAARTAAGAFTTRTITGTSPVSVTNGSGVSGDPTVACPTCVTAASALTSGVVVVGQGGQATAAATGVSVAAGVVTATGFAGPLTGNVTGTASGNATTARTITAGAGLTGGGDLSTDRTLDVAAGDTSITVAADAIAVALRSTGFLSTSSGVGLQACADNQIPKYTTASGWSCSADSTGGTPTFDSVASGTNVSAALVVGSGASLSYTGTGTVNANRVYGVNLASLSTGIAKITTGTGAVSIATAADIPDLSTYYAPLAATAAHTRPVTITGATDAIQLRVQCNATQTANPACFAVYKSDGVTPVLRVNADGSVEMGSGSGPQLFTNVAAPSTPSSGQTAIWADATDKILKSLNDAAVMAVTVVPSSAVSNQFLTGISSAGAITRAQPTPANLGAGSLAVAMTVASGGSVAPTSATVGTVSANQINGTSIAGAATGLYFNTTTTGALTIKPLVTTVATPGSDNNVPSEKAVRDAIAAAAGTPSFTALTSGTNTAATMTLGTGGTLTFSGSGVVNANQIRGVDPAGLATGMVKNTTSTGAFSIAVGADLPTHASRHQNGGDDEIATATAAANAIPKAGSGGTLAAGWIPDLSASYATASHNHTGTYQPIDADLTAIAGLSVARGSIITAQGETPAWAALSAGSQGATLVMGANEPAWNASLNTKAVGCTFDGGGATLTSNETCYARVPVAATIIGWSMEAKGTNPACTIDVLKIASGATLPTSSITASATPALTGTDNAVASTTLTGWTTSMTANDIVGFKVTKPGAATWAAIHVFYRVN